MEMKDQNEKIFSGLKSRVVHKQRESYRCMCVNLALPETAVSIVMQILLSCIIIQLNTFFRVRLLCFVNTEHLSHNIVVGTLEEVELICNRKYSELNLFQYYLTEVLWQMATVTLDSKYIMFVYDVQQLQVLNASKFIFVLLVYVTSGEKNKYSVKNSFVFLWFIVGVILRASVLKRN